MKIYAKQFTGNLNSDAAPEVVPEIDKLDAVNLRITSTKDGSVGRLVNIKGNTLVENTLPAGNNTCLNSYAYNPLSRIYYFLYNDQGHHSIWEYDAKSNTFTKLIEDQSIDTGSASVLNFRLDFRINHINVVAGKEVDDSGEPTKVYLAWVDPKPRYINTYRVKNNEYFVIDDQVLDAIKYQPAEQIRAEYIWDPDNIKNSLWGKAWRYRYRYVYKDGERSAWSPISKTPVPTSQYPSTVLANKLDNVMLVNFKLGPQDKVDKVEVAVSYSIQEATVWSDWYSFKTYSLDEDFGGGNTWQSVKFYGYEPLTPIDVRETDLLFDDIPLEAECQEVLNGNMLSYGNQTKDYDLPDPDTSISYHFYNTNLDYQGGLAYEIRSSDPGSGTFGYRIYIRHSNSFLSSIGTRFLDYTVEVGDLSQAIPLPANYYKHYSFDPTGGTTQDIANGLAAAMGGTAQTAQEPYYVDVLLQDEIITRVASGQIYLNPDNRLPEGSAKVWDNYTRCSVGGVYRDKAGRVTSVVKFGDIDTTGETFLPITTDATARCYLTINHLPPEYAHSLQIVRSKNQFNADYLEWVVGIISINNSDAGTVTVEFTRSAYDTKFPSNIIDYTPKKGDGIVFISNLTPGQEMPVEDTPHYTIGGFDPETGHVLVQGLDGRLVANDAWRVRFYRKIETPELYHEFGEQYPIIDPGTPSRRHSGNIAVQLADQSRPAIIDLRGNTWMTGRMYFRSDGVYIASGALQSTGMSDYFHSEVNDDGRPNLIDPSYKQRNFPVRANFGEPVSTESDLNNIARFYPDNYKDFDLNYGAIKRMAAKGNYLISYQELNSGAIPVELTVVEDAAGQRQYALSKAVLNEVRYYSGDYGIGDKPGSFARLDGYLYHIDPNKGCFVRLAGDGMNPVSTQDGMDGYFKNKIDLHRNAGDTIISFADQGNNEVLVHFLPVNGLEADTIAFSERSSGFPNRYSYHPDTGISLGHRMYTFKDGGMWLHESNAEHNNFYGEQHDSRLTVIFNGDRSSIKTFLAIALQTNDLWTIESVETSLSQESSLIPGDFTIDTAGSIVITNKEGVYFANLLRDTNSPGGLIEGDYLKGEWVKFTLVNSSPDAVYLSAMYLKAIASKHGIS